MKAKDLGIAVVGSGRIGTLRARLAAEVRLLPDVGDAAQEHGRGARGRAALEGAVGDGGAHPGERRWRQQKRTPLEALHRGASPRAAERLLLPVPSP